MDISEETSSSSEGRVKEPKLFFVVFKVISKWEEKGLDLCGFYNVEKRK